MARQRAGATAGTRALGLAVLAAALCSPPVALAGQPGGSETSIVPVPPPAGKWLGFNDHSPLHPARDVAPGTLAKVTRRAGANVYRMSVDWRTVEPERDSFDEAAWQRYETIAKAFRKRGQRILVTLSPAPAWARDPGVAQLCFGGLSCAYPPAENMLGEWSEYVREVVRRIPGAMIETWNEPNLSAFWMPFPEPERWARLHAATFAAAKSERRSTIVLAGGLAGTLTSPDRQEMPIRRFLERAYATGKLRGTSDALSLHLYSSNQRAMGPGSIFARSLTAMREVRDENGQRNKHIWITETGLSTSGGWAITPEQQADGLLRRYRRLMTMRDVDAMFIHTALDQIERGKTHRAYGFGIVADVDPLEVKPAFCAFSSRARAKPVAGCEPHIEGRAAKRCRKKIPGSQSNASKARALKADPFVRCMRRYVRRHQGRH